MNLSFENHEYETFSQGNHTPQSLRDSSSILEEQLDIQLFIFVELTHNSKFIIYQ